MMARITVYLSGSIAAYKGVEVVRGLQKAGHDVRVVMTAAATKLVGPATLNALTKYPVLTDLWNDQDRPIPHIELADWTELALVVPASANILAKMANGIADDILTTTVMAARSPVLIFPAMNTYMYENPIVQDNIKKLKSFGYHVYETAEGELACGDIGKGKLLPWEEIVKIIKEFE